MGIRFYCPKGHKLNVKEFLAGKKAICPYCGQRVLVPMESTRPSSRRPKSDGQAQSHIQESPSQSALDAVAAGFSIAAGSSIIVAGVGNVAADSSPDMPDRASGDNGAFSGSVSDMLTQMSEAAPAPSDPSASASNVLAGAGKVAAWTDNPLAEAKDPLSDANHFLWYVRPASGGQLGPAPNDIMRHWLAKGRIQADSFVWHDGWADWQLARNVFPQFEGPSSKLSLSGLLAEVPSPAPGAAEQPDLEQVLRAGPRRMQTLTKLILAALILALVAVLVVVVILSFNA